MTKVDMFLDDNIFRIQKEINEKLLSLKDNIIKDVKYQMVNKDGSMRYSAMIIYEEDNNGN